MLRRKAPTALMISVAVLVAACSHGDRGKDGLPAPLQPSTSTPRPNPTGDAAHRAEVVEIQERYRALSANVGWGLDLQRPTDLGGKAVTNLLAYVWRCRELHAQLPTAPGFATVREVTLDLAVENGALRNSGTSFGTRFVLPKALGDATRTDGLEDQIFIRHDGKFPDAAFDTLLGERVTIVISPRPYGYPAINALRQTYEWARSYSDTEAAVATHYLICNRGDATPRS